MIAPVWALIVQAQLMVLHCLTQGAFDAQALTDERIHVFGIEVKAIASCLLGGIHGRP